MITIPVQVSDELADRLRPLQDRLPEIIELGLLQLIGGDAPVTNTNTSSHVIEALDATGLVTFPSFKDPRLTNRHPIEAGGPAASEMIIAERRSSYAAKE